VNSHFSKTRSWASGSRCDGYQLGEDQGGRRQRYVLRLNHRRFRET
jgi:hypothetical protein